MRGGYPQSVGFFYFMAKDPAFLFYSNDFLTGVSDLTMEERGQYITLLCLQHQKGNLSEKTIRLSVGNAAADVMAKFSRGEDGLFFNQRLNEEIEKRKIHGEKQRQRAKDGWDKRKNNMPGHDSGNAAALPLEDENENEIENRIRKEKEAEKYLVPQMLNVFKSKNPTYMGSIDHDFKPLMSIAKFLAGQGNIDLLKDSDQILEVWSLLSEKISKDNFYCQKALITISNHIQSIAQTSVHGQKSKPGTSAARTEALRNW